jgi:hypothetical protein
LAKDIPIVVRQNFSVTIDFFPFTRTGTAANGGTLNVDLDPLLYLNQFDGAKLIQVHLDGVKAPVVDDNDVEQQTAVLRAFIAKQKLTAIGTPSLARYDPPWTLWFLRRNEVMLEVTSAQ